MGKDDGGRSPTRSVTGKLLSFDPSPSLKVSGSHFSIHTHPEQSQNLLAKSLKGELSARSGAGFSKVLASLDGRTTARACSHRLNFVRAAHPVGSRAATRAVPSMRDAWWATKAANAAASKRQMTNNTLMSVTAATKFSKLLLNRGGGMTQGGGGDDDANAGGGMSPGGGGEGAYVVEPVMRIEEAEVEAHREHVWKLWDKLKPAQEAAELATQALAEKADELWQAAYEEIVAARVGEGGRPEDKEYYDLTKIKRPTRTMSAAASCVILALDQLVSSMVGLGCTS